MATLKRRMMLSLPPELEHAFDDFREATGIAPASFAVQLLTECLPAIQAMSQAARIASTDQRKAADIMQKAMTAALHQGTAAQLDMYQATPAPRKARQTKP